MAAGVAAHVFWRESLPAVGIITREVPGGSFLLEGYPVTLMETLLQTFTPHHDPPAAHTTACGPHCSESKWQEPLVVPTAAGEEPTGL